MPARHLLGVADHAEQAVRLRRAVDRELRVENLVAAVLAVGLREHHQLDVAGVAAERAERAGQVLDLVTVERQPEFGVRLDQRGAAAAQHVDVHQCSGGAAVEQVRGVARLPHHALGHAVVQQACGVLQNGVVERLGGTEQAAFEAQPVVRDALDATDLEAAVARDVGRLGRPRRHRAQTRRDDDQRALVVTGVRLTVTEQRLQRVGLLRRERLFGADPVHIACIDRGDAGADRLQARQ